ncbi:hypothetical protein BGZ83_007705 [Gryganskiella cystojenkinii]|nr:hypothetical protein BGZ83_007705 [Gryganskiella cystojenkinii]
MTTVNQAPQFHCSVNYDGKVFLFGNAVGFAVFDIPSSTWSTTPPTFKSSAASVTNFQNQVGINSAVHPDGYTISIFSTTPPVYMELYSRNMTIDAIAVPNYPNALHGFCMDVLATTPPKAVVCGGSNSDGTSYTDSCWQLGLGDASASRPFGTMLYAQDGCSLVAFGTQFLIVPGYIAAYHVTAPLATDRNLDMQLYDWNANTWKNISNLQTGFSFPIVEYPATNMMPGTNVMFIYGGKSPANGNSYNTMATMDLSTFTWVHRVDPAKNPFPTPSANDPSGNSLPSDSSKSGSNIAAIAGGAAAGVVVLGALIGFLVYKRRRSRHQPLQQQDSQQLQQLQQHQHRDQNQYQNQHQNQNHIYAQPMEEQTYAYKYATEEEENPIPVVYVKRESRGPQLSYKSQSLPQNPQAIV